MKKEKKEYRGLIIGGIAAAAVLLVLSVVLVQRSPVRLARRYRDFQTCSFSGVLETEGAEPVAMQITDEQLHTALNDYKVYRSEEPEQTTHPCFRIETGEESSLSVTVSSTGTVCVESGDASEKTTYWADDGSLYDALYALHMQNAQPS